MYRKFYKHVWEINRKLRLTVTYAMLFAYKLVFGNWSGFSRASYSDMLPFKNKFILLLFLIKIDLCVNVHWDKIQCTADTSAAMPEGRVQDIGRFPWLGIVQHSFYMAGKIQFAVTGAVLVHPAYAIAPAEDMAKILPHQLINNTKLVLWRSTETKYALDVKDYILHPQYHNKETFATIALLDLMTWGETGIGDFAAPVLPVCMPLTGSGTYKDLYAVKMTDEGGEMGKEIIKMKFVDTSTCDEFYYKNQLMYSKTTPFNSLCAKSEIQPNPCIWDSGVALVTKQSWGFWKLLGFGLRGPGCGAPARFLNIYDYLPWINDVISEVPFDGTQEDAERTHKFVLRTLSPIKLIMYKADDIHLNKQLGQCGMKERGNVLFKDTAELLCNKNFVQGFYFVAVYQIAEFLCATVEIDVSSRTNAAVWLEHHCHRDVRGLAHGMDLPDNRKQDCFLYFKTVAFMEFRFFFSFKANLEVTLYGHDVKRFIPNPFKTSQYTTPWWPTWTGLRPSWFVPYASWWYDM